MTLSSALPNCSLRYCELLWNDGVTVELKAELRTMHGQLDVACLMFIRRSGAPDVFAKGCELVHRCCLIKAQRRHSSDGKGEVAKL